MGVEVGEKEKVSLRVRWKSNLSSEGQNLAKEVRKPNTVGVFCN
jgi:hypothetical protein